MKAILCSQFGGPEGLTIETLDTAILRGQEVRIAVHASGINFPDVLMVKGKHQLTPALPFIPGGEVAGVITELGPDVTGYSPGQRVMAVTFTGGLAEEVIAQAHTLVAIPEQMDFVTAAVFQGGHTVAHYALKRRAQLTEGEVLLLVATTYNKFLA